MKILVSAAVFLSPLMLLIAQGCTEDPVPVESRVIPDPAPKEVVKIAPAPQPRVIVGDKKTIINGLLSRKLGLPTRHKTTYQKAHAAWSLQCGKALGVDGNAIDFAKSKLAKQASDGYLENNYCALFREQGQQHRLVEFDYGSTDSQVFTWLERHKIPTEMLK